MKDTRQTYAANGWNLLLLLIGGLMRPIISLLVVIFAWHAFGTDSWQFAVSLLTAQAILGWYLIQALDASYRGNEAACDKAIRAQANEWCMFLRLFGKKSDEDKITRGGK